MFYKGVVEKNNDEKGLGRVKVRIIGKHTTRDSRTNAEKMTTDDLPWAMPISPIGSSSISGICDFDVPVVNSIVVCGYFDTDEQELFYIGTLGLMGDTKLEGYGDPKSEHPNKKYPFSDLVIDQDDIFENQLINNSLFTEAEVNHTTIYPKNKVIATESGHVIELDDSDGAERIRIRHTSGSFNEYHENGDNVEKLVKDKYLLAQTLNIHTDVDCNLYSKGLINVHCESDINVYGEANINVTSDVDTNLTVHGNMNASVGGNTTMTTTGFTDVSSGGNVTIDSGGVTTLNSSGSINVNSATDITVNAPMINLNP